MGLGGMGMDVGDKRLGLGIALAVGDGADMRMDWSGDPSTSGSVATSTGGVTGGWLLTAGTAPTIDSGRLGAMSWPSSAAEF